jgi:seryl-tRNA synthetase
VHPELIWYENGQSGYGGALLALQRKIDAFFLKWAAEVKAVEYAYPPFLRASDLARIDYLKSFPHLATFPVTLAPDEKNVESFVSKLDGQPLQLTATNPLCDVLTPAACYHVYVMLRGEKLQASRYVTTRATCFRREDHYTPLERQWGFSMREIVCVGSMDEVQNYLAAMQGKVESFFAEYRLPVRFETATDPFFKPYENPKALMQKLAPVKAEMVWDGRLAIGSVNFHRNYFGEGFEIERDGAHAFSGCVAFGVERWMSLFLSRFGHDPRGWPEPFAVRPEEVVSWQF